jgi:hypothetical protein
MRDITASVLARKNMPEKTKMLAKWFIPLLLIATGFFAVTRLSTVFAANPAVSIDQCDNGPVGGTPVSCDNPGNPNNHYGSGNVNASKAHWNEGDVLPYRAVLHNLNPGINTVTFSFDTAKSSELRHAIDYLASFDVTETTGAATSTHANGNDPCGDIFVCTPSTPTATATITNPAYLTTSYPTSCANGTFTGTALSGQLIKAWSAAAGGVSAMSLSFPDASLPTSGDCTPRFKITFTVASGTSDVVIAWGGHIAANGPVAIGGYWGTGNAIPSGSPYHMHAGFPQESPVPTSFNVGNQDLQLASDAIIAAQTPTVTTELHNDSNESVIALNSTAGLNTSVHDKATVGGVTNGTPTGSVTFRFYTSSAACTNDTTFSAGTTKGTVTLVSGVAHPSTASGALGPGTYAFKAQYASNDTTKWNNATSSCEVFNIGKAQLGINTTVHSDSPDQALAGNLALGSGAHDSATVTGKVGSLTLPDVTFYFFAKGVACTNGSTTGATPLNTVAPDSTTGIAHPSTSQTNLAAGTYNFMAVVGSNTNYDGTTSNCEPFTVNKSQLTMESKVHDTNHVDKTSSSVALGSVMHDTAKVTGGTVGGFSTEAITFKFYSNNECTGDGTTVSNTGADENDGTRDRSAASISLGAGSYAYKAFVAGNNDYLGTDSGCELFTVNKAQLTVTTNVHDANHTDKTNSSVPLGSVMHDTATVTGGVGGFTVPTPTFTLTSSYTNSCTDGTAVGNDGAEGAAAKSADSTALGAGSYAYRASVVGNDNYIGANSACEPFGVNKVQLGISTTVHNESGDVALVGNLPLGGGAHDSATVTNKVGTFTLPNVTFYFFAKDVACTNGSTAGATQLNTVAPNGSDVAHPSTSKTNLAAGSYNFMAVVVGDSNYDGATSNCEPFTVDKGTPAVATEIHKVVGEIDSVLSGALPLGGTVHDKATVTGNGIAGFEPSGNVEFTFFVGDCVQPSATLASGSVALSGTDPGIAHPSDNQGPLTADNYSFRAHYVGDSNYNDATSDCEPFTVSKSPLGISTTVHNESGDVALVGNLPLGGGAHDSAAVTGKVGAITLPDVTFYFFPKGITCTNGDISGATALNTISPDGTTGVAHPSTSETSLAAGTYNFMAVVAGDTNYTGATSDCEPFTVNKARLGITTNVHDTAHGDITSSSVALGSVTHDTATVSGGVSGFALPATSFTMTSNFVASCSAGSAVTNNGTEGSAIKSADSSALNAGSYAYRAVVASDTNYTGATSDCEPFTVNKAQLSVSTDIHNPAHAVVTSVGLGTAVHDTATVTGQVGSIAPTGATTFYFGSGVAESCKDTNVYPVIATSGSLDSGKPRSVDTSALSAGNYQFWAHVAGDDNYISADSSCEPLTVNKADLTLSTVIHDASHGTVTSVSAGSTVHDQANVSGIVSGFAPVNNVTFAFYRGGNCTTGTVESAGSAAIVSGIAHPSDSKGPLNAGAYAFKASYVGTNDPNYNSANAACEPLTVNKVTPSISTTPSAGGLVGVVLNDTATLSGGNNPTGDVTFRLYPPSDPTCLGTASYTFTDSVAPYATSPGFTSNAAGVWHWTAHYVGDVNNNPADSACASEAVTVTAPALLWCSPGFWATALKQNRAAVLTYLFTHTGSGLVLTSFKYNNIPNNLKVPLSKKAPSSDPTLAQVLLDPSGYGGPAFNAVANYIALRLGWNGTQNTGENCPLDAHGNLTTTIIAI